MEKALAGETATPRPSRKPRETAQGAQTVRRTESFEIRNEYADAKGDLMVSVPKSRIQALKLITFENRMTKQPMVTLNEVVLSAIDLWLETNGQMHRVKSIPAA